MTGRYAELHARSLADPNGFWGEAATMLIASFLLFGVSCVSIGLGAGCFLLMPGRFDQAAMIPFHVQEAWKCRPQA